MYATGTVLGMLLRRRTSSRDATPAAPPREWNARAAAVVLLALCCTVASASAAQDTVGNGRDDGRTGNVAGDDVPARPVVSAVPGSFDETRLAISPDRFDPAQIPPGSTLRFGLTVRNTTRDAVRLTTVAVPLAGSKRADSFAEPVGLDTRTGRATRWVHFPAAGFPDELRSGQQVRFGVDVRVPADARPGSYAIGLGVRQTVNQVGVGIDPGTAPRVRANLILTSIAVVRVAGDAQSDARLRSWSSPHVVWGGGKPLFEATVDNVGDTDLALDAQVDLAPFWGAAGRKLPTDARPTLPDGRQRFSLRWSDPPLVGWFQPDLTVVGGSGSGVRITKTLPTVWVLPPWWMFGLLALAIALPIWRGRRRRRDPRYRDAKDAARKDQAAERIRKTQAKQRAAQARRRR